ncbi:uncharacterized protein LOC106466954 [Limulus polyphemus]|uniref:Uncharacterized protein LOC106466954 n=1 Tax=Limulus polyphemus TaxID=6850 RepID=A0ABM1BIK7_LIMPO|nr:uncharacterized protein LOC106466954 [Limulus polyphemus]
MLHNNNLFISLLFSDNSTKSKAAIEVSVYDIHATIVEIDWHSRVVHQQNLSDCELVYRQLDSPEQVEVWSNFIPTGHVFPLTGLKNNVTYRFQMICYDMSSRKLESNYLEFTTGVKKKPKSYIVSSDSYRSNYDTVSRENPYHDEEGLRDVQSSSVILGAVCGIVGFLIINVTVVMAVKRYSQRQMRHRRILVVEERDDYEFLYFQEFE